MNRQEVRKNTSQEIARRCGSVFLRIIGAPIKQGNFWGRQRDQREHQPIEQLDINNKFKKRRLLRISGRRKNLSARAEGTVRENSPTTSQLPPEKDLKPKIERGTLNNGADSSSFSQKNKLFGIHI